jgi:hypothetical protein
MAHSGRHKSKHTHAGGIAPHAGIMPLQPIFDNADRHSLAKKPKVQGLPFCLQPGHHLPAIPHAAPFT